LATVPVAGPAETAAAIESAAAALGEPVALPVRQRWLLGIQAGLLAERAPLARLITLENGKPLQESLAEVEYAAGFFGFFAGQLDHLAPRELPGRIRDCRWTVRLRPAGVAALITPWNFPLAMLAKKLSAALAAGCAVVARPASATPLSALALWTLLERAGVPLPRVNLLLGPAEPIARALCAAPAVRLVSFTGSTEVGRQLAAEAGPRLKRLALELGGNAPFLVFADADLEAAAAALVTNKFRASGQTCVCTNRVWVEAPVRDRFAGLVAGRVAQLRTGNGLEPDTDVGPLINRAAFDKVAAHVSDALAGGACRWVGDDPPRPRQDWGAFYPPTVLTGVNSAMRVCREETFGPVVAIGEVGSEAEALARANETPQGLAAYVFTRDTARAERLLAGLEFGHVAVNSGTGPTPEAPFGGLKESGYGREGGLEGLLEFTEPQTCARAGEG
jgi:succinate-semialdehyde dehydrogenase/glutarate-semialdehyde dehydrogenase